MDTRSLTHHISSNGKPLSTYSRCSVLICILHSQDNKNGHSYKLFPLLLHALRRLPEIIFTQFSQTQSKIERQFFDKAENWRNIKELPEDKKWQAWARSSTRGLDDKAIINKYLDSRAICVYMIHFV